MIHMSLELYGVISSLTVTCCPGVSDCASRSWQWLQTNTQELLMAITQQLALVEHVRDRVLAQGGWLQDILGDDNFNFARG